MAQKLTVSNNGLELTNCLQQWLMENSETKKRSCYERLILLTCKEKFISTFILGFTKVVSNLTTPIYSRLIYHPVEKDFEIYALIYWIPGKLLKKNRRYY